MRRGCRQVDWSAHSKIQNFNNTKELKYKNTKIVLVARGWRRGWRQVDRYAHSAGNKTFNNPKENTIFRSWREPTKLKSRIAYCLIVDRSTFRVDDWLLSEWNLLTILKKNLNDVLQIFIQHSHNCLCLSNSELFEQSGWNVWVRICWILPQFTSDLIQSQPLAGARKIPQHYNSSQFDMIWLYEHHHHPTKPIYTHWKILGLSVCLRLNLPSHGCLSHYSDKRREKLFVCQRISFSAKLVKQTKMFF